MCCKILKACYTKNLVEMLNRKLDIWAQYLGSMTQFRKHLLVYFPEFEGGDNWLGRDGDLGQSPKETST